MAVMRGLDFENERYVRVYTRDTADWMLLGWEGQALWSLIQRKLDRAGVLELGHHEPARAVAAVTGMPLDVVQRALPLLVAPGGLLELRDGFLVDPEFLEAQEAKQSDAARSRAAREKRRDHARAAVVSGAVTIRDGSDRAQKLTPSSSANGASTETSDSPSSDTKPDGTVTNRDAPATKTSETVTPCLAVPSRTVRESARGRATQLPLGTIPSTATNRQGKPKNKPKRKRAEALPETWEPSEEHRSLAKDWGLDCLREAATFRDHASANGRVQVNWDPAFRNWLRRALDFRTGVKRANGSGKHAPPQSGTCDDSDAKRRAAQRYGTDEDVAPAHEQLFPRVGGA